MKDGGTRFRAIAAVLALLLTGGLLSSCPGDETETPQPTLLSSPQGYELYSWFGGPDWHFALVIATDRVKVFEEISARDLRIEGTASLMDLLSQLPEGERVVWSAALVPGTTLPPVKTVDEVSRYCSRNGIRLEIAD
jgi:hypothetical protein